MNSEFCGKELRVFIGRLEQWEKSSENVGKDGRAIIPVLWVKTSLPDVMRKFQHDEAAFPADYHVHGLRTLFQLNKYQDKRTQVVITLAERIFTAATRTNLPSSSPIPHFNFIPSVFHEEQRGTRYGVALVALINGGTSAVPYEIGPTFSTLMESACAQGIPWRELEQDAKLRQRLRETADTREAVLIVADLETLRNPLYQKVFEDVDAEASKQCALLIIRRETGRVSADLETNIQITIKSRMPNVFTKARLHDWNSIYSHESLRQRLEETITRLRQSLVAEAPALKVHDASLEAAAAAEGIPVERHPALIGPGVTVS